MAFMLPVRSGFAILLMMAPVTACSYSTSGDQPSTDRTLTRNTNTVAKAKTSPLTIGVVMLRNRRLTLLASEDGPRFDVTDSEGRLLSRGIDAARLAERHADLYRVYRTSYATRRPGEPFLDARVDPSVGLHDAQK